MGVQSSGPLYPLTLIVSSFGYGDAWRCWFVQHTSGDLNEAKSTHLSAAKSWKLCWNAWEPQHHMNSACISADGGFWTYDVGIFAYLDEYYNPLKTDFF